MERSFSGTPKLHKEGKTSRMCAQISRVLVLNSYPTPPPPFRNPVSAPVIICTNALPYSQVQCPAVRRVYVTCSLRRVRGTPSSSLWAGRSRPWTPGRDASPSTLLPVRASSNSPWKMGTRCAHMNCLTH